MAKSRLSDLNKKLHQPQKKVDVPAEGKRGLEKIEANIPRGERANFLKLTITMPPAMLIALRSIGLKRKVVGRKDTDTSSLIREALSSFISSNQ